MEYTNGSRLGGLNAIPVPPPFTSRRFYRQLRYEGPGGKTPKLPPKQPTVPALPTIPAQLPFGNDTPKFPVDGFNPSPAGRTAPTVNFLRPGAGFSTEDVIDAISARLGY